MDVTVRAAVRALLHARRPTAVVNAAGKTGRPNVDGREHHPVETWDPDVCGALHRAEACGETGRQLVHLGSGCAFYGASAQPGGWREHDPANPVSLDSRTKYAVDEFVTAVAGLLRWQG